MRDITSTTTEQSTSLGLYFHIPFCERKCSYCGFLSFVPENRQVCEEYIELLCREIALYGEGQTVDTIFIGGGTPSLLTGEQITRLLDTVRSHFAVTKDAEITMEGNPESLTKEKAMGYLAAGVNRFSMGVQSFQEASLQVLGRKHTAKRAVEAFEALRSAGATNINLDLMFATPNQTLSDWKEDLATCLKLSPEHLSFYGLQIEEGTPFYEAYRKEWWDIANAEEEREMYETAFRMLTESGYRVYEISNAAKPGKECRHNRRKYWDFEPFIGMGPGASSFYQERRYRNTDSFHAWSSCLQDGRFPIVTEGDERSLDEETASALSQYKLPEENLKPLELPKESQTEQMETYCIMALRTADGIEYARFCELFDKPFADAYEDILPTLQEYQDLGWLKRTQTHCRLTLEGIAHSNEISGAFLR